MLVNTRSVEIEFGDCDPAGIVYYPNYFRMFDASTAHLFETALGMKKIAWIRHFGIVGIPMVDTGAKFIRPSAFGDVVSIETTITELRRSSFVVSHKLYNGGELAIEAHEVRVWAGRDPENPDRIKSRALPPEVVEALSR
ncbi:4-hydroxybenzoyl-CoA thioesterase family active site protein [Devosia sp. LC5]|uniref:acyl-CoA thioesterase n=1 Tax=Devosia sp. LC5 TaxID=1502724 RepID=UPI0004E462F3|nr:thioesterase family protein [Devosia sp. LC5]KFC71211.1 4-hydroxybenzoyl-CoA thioesterase family active site protein [Devosia sp. LC5]